MFHRLNVALYGFMILTFLSLTGCPPPAATKPEVSAQNAKTKAAAVKTSAPSSSLEAAREGRTPAEGPLKDVYFDFDKYDLRADARNTLKANADWLKTHPAARAEIEGHCDERGTTEYNLALGAKRAQAAKDYLSSLGVAKERLSTKSYGKELPVCTEHNEACWQKNRHDRFVVLPARTA